MSTRSELHILLEAADQEDSPFMRQAQRRRAFFSTVLASGDTEALEMLMEESDSDWSTSDCSDCEDDDAKEEFKEELPRKKRTYFKRCVICPFCFVQFVVISFRLSLSEGIGRQASGGSIAILLTEAIGGTPLIAMASYFVVAFGCLTLSFAPWLSGIGPRKTLEIGIIVAIAVGELRSHWS